MILEIQNSAEESNEKRIESEEVADERLQGTDR